MQMHEPPLYDARWAGVELAADATHRYVWLSFGGNIRLIAVPKGEQGLTGYDHGWCYPQDPAAVAASVAGWDPDVQDEPTGWHKRPTWPVRRAPRREVEPRYNRVRCVHGSYVEDGCRDLYCAETSAWADAHGAGEDVGSAVR